MKVNMNLGSKQNEETFNDYFGEDLLFGNISTLSEWVCLQKLPVHHKPLIAIKINHNKQTFKLSERANDLSQLFDTLPDELNSIYSDYVEFNFSQKLKGMLTITVDWPQYLANLDQMNVDNSSFTDSLLKIKQFRNALNNLANEITPETKDSLTKQDVVDQTSDFDDSTKQSEDDNMKELTQIAHASETGNSLPKTEWGQDANDLSNSDKSNDSEKPDSAQTTDNNPVKPEDDSTEDDDSTASDNASSETFNSTQTNTEPETTEPETTDKETADNSSDTTGDGNDESGETGETGESANSDTNSSENDDPIEDDKIETSDDRDKSVNDDDNSDNEESSDNDSENPENRYVKLSSEKFDHMIELLDNLVTSKTETKPDTDEDTDNSTNNETPIKSADTSSDNNDTSDETTKNESTKDDTEDKHGDSDGNQDDSEAKRDDQAMANLIGDFGF